MTSNVDSDLRSVQQARDLASAAKSAMRAFQFTSQEKVDAICEAMVAAALRESERLAQMAHDETGFGYVPHKKLKNDLAAAGVWDEIKDVPTCGVLRRDEEKKIIEIGWPVGVLACLTPSTNPTSTAIFKILIGVKARNAVIVAPHPSALKATVEAVRVLREAGEAAGMPAGLVGCMTELSLAGTNELMRHPATAMILATGGPGMVKAAHSCGKPALGVGPGNVPVYVDRSAHIVKAAQMIVESKSFDCSTICATEQCVLADAPIADRLKAEMQARGAHWLTKDEADKLANSMFRDSGLMRAEYVGRTPQAIGKLAGIQVPDSARILVADLEGVGKKYPLSQEKLTPVLAWMQVRDWHDGCEKAIQLLEFGGPGHTVSIHSRDEEAILAFGIEKPAFRIVVNTWSSMGGVGYTTGLNASFTLAPGGIGGASVTDNVSVHNVLNVKRIAYNKNQPDPIARAWGGVLDTQEAPEEPTVKPGPVLAEPELIEKVVRQLLAELKK